MTPTQLASLSSRRIWLMVPEVLTAMFATIQQRVKSGDKLEIQAAAQPKGRESGTIAVLPMHGVIEQRRSWLMDFIGGTSTDEFGAMYDAAMSDPKVKGVVVDIDSPGGTVGGVQELADKIHGSRGQKPVVAVANSMAASAAYWVGSAFDKLFVTPGGDVGSVGVYSLHMDYSKMMEADGVTPTLFQVPEFKAEFAPFFPLTDEAKEHEQKEIERVYGEFVSAVARNRGTTASNVKANYGKGRTVDARQAVSLGMADRVATLDKVIQRMQAGAFKPGSPLQANEDWDTEPVQTPASDWRAMLATQQKASELRLKGVLR
jgi:capsid assembly protease